MDECGPNILARLVALNERTRVAWAHPHNKLYYMPASFQGFSARDSTSRESTPSDMSKDGADHIEDREPELRLTLTGRPKNISKGWMFGSDPAVCDLYCGERDEETEYNIGRQTFSITISKQGAVILTHLRDRIRTSVQYGLQKAGDRREFVWIMFPSCRNIVITSANQLKFRVIVARSNALTDAYEGLRDQFLKEVEEAIPSIPCLTSTPKTKPFYYRREDKELGRGSFGKVCVVVDVSTGIEYAGKTFFGKVIGNEADILAKQNHENILHYVNLSSEDGLLLVTEYLKGGNLARPWRIKDRAPWKLVEILKILIQCLRGLASLHASPNSVIHRDIKPENILVEPRESGPWIRLADFGLATQGTKCTSLAGTFLYTAPEAFSSQPYNFKVDLWSVGVVILQLLLEGRLPEPTGGYAQGPQWCMDINRVANRNYRYYDFEDRFRSKIEGCSLKTLLWGFIACHMLSLDPAKRWSAEQCLNHPTLSVFNSRMTSLAELRQKDTGHQSSESAPNSTVKEVGERISTQVDIDQKFKPNAAEYFPSFSGEAASAEELLVKSILSSSSVPAPMDYKETSPAVYDPGMEEDVALNVQTSRTALPPQAPRPDIPQPLGYGLVFDDSHNDASGSQQEAADEEPTVKHGQGSKARAGTKSGRMLQSGNSAAVGHSGLSVAGPRRRASERQRNGVSKMKSSGSPSVGSHHRRPPASEPSIESSSAGNRRSPRGKDKTATAKSLEDR